MLKKEHTILIAGAQNLIAETFQSVLNSYQSFRVVGVAADLPGLEQSMLSLYPEIVLLDQRLLGNTANGNAVSILLQMRKEHRSSRMILLIDDYQEDFIVSVLKSGAKGYLSKDSGISQLVNSIQAVSRDEIWAERRVLAVCLDHYQNLLQNQQNMSQFREKDELTTREQEVLEYLTNGCSNKEIAEQLFTSEKTVTTHLYNLFRKLKVTDRLQATLCAFQKAESGSN